MLSKQAMDRSLEVTDSFSVDDADLQNTLLLAHLEISENDILDLARRKGVQVQNTVDGQWHGLTESVIRHGQSANRAR
jgi:hypothetical protein